MASAAAMPSPSAQPCSVLPTASQKLASPSCSPSVPSVSLIGGKWFRGSTPMRGRTSNSASTPATLTHGSARSGIRRRADAESATWLQDQIVEVRLLLYQAIFEGEL